ncbi:MAG: SDR family NAD(P)-dependent oxidoreductase, partial [Desulfosarcinaceae bacterium]
DRPPVDRDEDWSGAAVLLVHPPSAADLARTLQQKLARRGARTTLGAYETLSGAKSFGEVSHCIALLEREPVPPARLATGLEQMVTRLAAVATGNPATLQGLAFVQFGGGYFGRSPQGVHPDIAGCTALASGLHHEHPGLRVRVVDLCPDLALNAMADLVLDEFETKAAFDAAGYDDRKRRWVMRPQLSQPVDYTHRELHWRSGDVILVTGGGKGITAECALAAARACGASLVLAGSSPLPPKDGDPQHAVHATLERMARAGVQADYHTCDITRFEEVAALVKKIHRIHGPIRGLIHGAGINRPRPAVSVKAGEAWREIQPKVVGLLNLWQALADDPPELVVGLSSIIGITGMPGNAWYGFANEALDLLLQAIQAQSAATRTQSVAFSIWGETGMGARMGSVARLAQMGIDAIPTEEGSRRFADLFTRDPGSPTVIVTARLGGLDTWRLESAGKGPEGRFSRKPVLLTPGVEAVFRTRLTLERDLYLADHVYQGSCLFPTVFGLEAMAQAAFAAAGRTGWQRLHLNNIQLRRPITVEPDQGAEILIWARVAEKNRPDDPLTVQAGIRKTDSGVREDYFSAELVVDEPDLIPVQEEAPWKGNLPLSPVDDLYRESLLFQGPRFQRIEQVISLEGDGREQGTARLGARRRPGPEVPAVAFASAQDGPLVLPDPFFSDALLQGVALLVPQDPCLPVAIDRLDFYGPAPRDTGLLRVQVTLMACRDKTFHAAVRALDSQGRTLMGLEGYCLKILRHVDAYPTLAELKSPARRDLRQLDQASARAAQRFGVELPVIGLDYLPGIHQKALEQRHGLEKPLIDATLEHACGRWDLPPARVAWRDSGRPGVDGLDRAKLDLSLSHDDRLCLAVSGPGAQGCDVAPITPRSRQAWEDLLGRPHSRLLDPLMEDGDSLDQAGTRVWAALEAARKALETAALQLEVKDCGDGAVLFDTRGGRDSLLVLTLALRLTWGGAKIVALAVKQAKPARSAAGGFPEAFTGLCGHPAYEVRPDGPGGELIFVQRFPVTFKPGAQLSRNVYFTNFFDWMGHAREASTFPVMRALIDLLGSGRWGSVTNYSRLEILGEARTGDLVQVRMWTSANGGPQQGTMTLQYDFTRLTPGGRH